MDSAKERKPVSRNEGINERAPYQAPAITYEGKISIRAGSPVGDRFGPPDPFNFPGADS